MKKSVADFKKELAGSKANSAWSKGVREYAQELFSDWAENRGLADGDAIYVVVTERDLLNGAKSWRQYSYGGCSLIFDGDICERLCSPSIQKRCCYGEKQLSSAETWLDLQAKALKQAARLVLRTANGRE